jgi:acyl-CoA synthetase (AMP-forming)/AMP-acid ligase II
MGWREGLAVARRADLSVGVLMENLASVFGDSRLIEESGDGLRLTYREAAELVARQSAAIRQQIGRGDRVVISVPNGYLLFLLCLAVARAGGVAVPVNPKMSEAEIDHVISDSEAALVLKHDPADDGSDGDGTAVAVEPQDLAMLFYTSGTTGKPKGAELTHRALVRAVPGLVRAGLLRQFHRDEAVTGMPVAHIAGFTVLISMAACGVPIYLLTHFRPNEALDAIQSRRATAFIGVPAMYRMMVEAGAEQRDLKSVRLWSSGADVMPTELAQTFQRLGGLATLPVLDRTVGLAAFVDGYGMVELGGGVASRVFPPGLPLPIPALVRPMRGNKLRVVDDAGKPARRGQVGELEVKGRGVMRGYHGREEATTEAMTPDGWLRTGDLARERLGGFFEFAGRKKDVIKHGGYSVFAVEVEEALAEHPSVLEAAVLGLPDERKGEVPVAVVRVQDGVSPDEAELIAWAKERLADYKVPGQILFVDELPRTGTEKVQKAKLKELFGAGR